MIDCDVAGGQQTHGVFTASIADQNINTMVNHQLGSLNACTLPKKKGRFQKRTLIGFRIKKVKKGDLPKMEEMGESTRACSTGMTTFIRRLHRRKLLFEFAVWQCDQLISSLA